MRYSVLCAIVLTASCAAPQPGAERQGPPEELAGRTPGPPSRCVTINQFHSLRVSENDRHTLLYGDGKILWANNLGSQCGFRYDDVLVTEPVSSNYCRGDLVRSFDRNSRIPGPSCVLGDFVPYSR